MQRIQQVESARRNEEGQATSANVAALGLGLAANRLSGSAPTSHASAPPAQDTPSLGGHPEEHEEDASGGLNLMAFMEGFGESETPETRKVVTVQTPSAETPVWTRPLVARALAVGGLLAGCAAGAFALGPAGLVLTLAAEALAFAGGVLISKAHTQQLEQVNKQLAFQANHDPLTGLRNRGSIFEFLAVEVERAAATHQPLSVVMGDLDHFKSINDTYGHLAGDAVLQEVSRRISAVLRQQDAVGRYGGEETLIVLPGTPGGQAVLVADRIRQLVAEEPVKTEVGSIPVTISLGVASVDSPGSINQGLLLQAADEALYRAKREGRNRVAFSTCPG